MAGGFTFRLEVLLRVRKQARDEQRRVVADVLRDISMIEAHIRRTNEMLRQETNRSLQQRGDSEIDVADLRSFQLYKGRLHREIREGELALDEQQQRLASEREKLAEASKQVKVLEKLRQKQWERYQEKLSRQERMLEDETATQMFLRGRMVN